MTKIEITPCLLGMEFLYNFDCILNLRKNELFCGTVGKTLQLSHHNDEIRICFKLLLRIMNYLVAAKVSLNANLLMKKVT